VSGRRRAIFYAALALAIPLPALALTGGGESGLNVEASLGGCGVSGNGIVCEIKASFGSIDGADYYTASVAAPDGSVTDFGQVAGAGGGGTSLWVPYVGNGTYSVTVTAWGDEDGGKPEVIDRDKASASDATDTEELRKRDVAKVGEGTYEVPEDQEDQGEQGEQGEQAEPPAADVPTGVPPAPCEPAEAPAPAPAPPAGEGEEPPADPSASSEPGVAPSTEVAPSVEPAPTECPPVESAPVAPAP
jgi:hypothetical protein